MRGVARRSGGSTNFPLQIETAIGVDGLPQSVVPTGTTDSPLVNEGAEGGFAASLSCGKRRKKAEKFKKTAKVFDSFYSLQ